VSATVRYRNVRLCHMVKPDRHGAGKTACLSGKAVGRCSECDCYLSRITTTKTRLRPDVAARNSEKGMLDYFGANFSFFALKKIQTDANFRKMKQF
jgi:hypothetical protein